MTLLKNCIYYHKKPKNHENNNRFRNNRRIKLTKPNFMFKKTRTFTWFDETGKPRTKNCQYTIVYEKGQLKRVINEFGFLVEPNSECFEYFKNNL